MRLGLALGLVLMASVAHAEPGDPTDVSDVARANGRKAAEQLERHAKDSGDDNQYAQCGQAYLDLYNKDPRDPSRDELLYNAGVCFQAARSTGLAIQMFELLMRTLPNSKLVPRAVGRVGRLHATIGNYAKAAEKLELYATRYAGEKDAFDALSDAIHYRGALGDHDKQIASTQFFIKMYGMKKPSEAMQASFGLVEVYGKKSPADREKHLREFLRQYGGKDPELTIRAHVELGESIWRRACPVPLIDGLCLKVQRERVLPIVPKKVKPTPAAKRCGTPTMSVVAVPRTKALVEEAMRSLYEGAKLFERTQPQTAAARHFYAKTKLLQGDRDLEAFAAVKFPANLNFSPSLPQQAKASKARFDAFIQERTKVGGRATVIFESVFTIKDGLMAIAAAHRLGVISHEMANALLGAEIPRDVRTGEFAADKVEAFCDTMTDIAEPLLQRAISSYDVCASKAAELGIDDTLAQACVRERATLGPTTFGLTAELLPASPLPLPTFDEEAVRKARHHPAPFADALDKFWASYGPQPIPEPQCSSLAKKFEAFAQPAKSADAWFMAGMTYGRCNQIAKAKSAYATAVLLDPRHGKSASNLAELEHRAGNLEAARKQWTHALTIDAKLFGAHLGLATLTIEDLRKTTDAPTRKQLIATADSHASNAAAVGNAGSPMPYVQLAILALQQDRVPLAKAHAAEAKKIDTAPHVDLLLAAIAIRQGQPALHILEAAAAAPWKLDDTHFALALHYLALRRHNDAAAALAKIKRTDYDVLIARGVAARGIGKLADAEARYHDALKLDPSRAEAHFNLGVLWKDYTAARATDPVSAKAAFKKAADAFRRTKIDEAKQLADDCDKAIAAL